VSPELPLGTALGTIDHEVPFQASTSGPFPLPTAVQLVALRHDTSSRALVRLPDGFGLATDDHEVPFQVSTSVRPMIP
jgi:hypothetical protein